jgi:hypothetical protein
MNIYGQLLIGTETRDVVDTTDNTRGKFRLAGRYYGTRRASKQDGRNRFVAADKLAYRSDAKADPAKSPAKIQVSGGYLAIVRATDVIQPPITPPVEPPIVPPITPPVVPPPAMPGLLSDDPSTGFGLIPFASFGGSFRAAQAWCRALFAANTGCRIDPSKLTTIAAKDLRPNRDYRGVKWTGQLTVDGGLTKVLVEDFMADGSTYCIRADMALGVQFRWGTLYSVESAMVYGETHLSRIECEGSGGDILKLEMGSADLVWGYHTGMNEGAHADFNQIVGGGPVVITRCFADMAKIAGKYRSNSFFQYQDGVTRTVGRYLVSDGFNRIFNVDATASLVDEVYTFGTSQYGMGSVSSAGGQGDVYSAITGQKLPWSSQTK